MAKYTTSRRELRQAGSSFVVTRIRKTISVVHAHGCSSSHLSPLFPMMDCTKPIGKAMAALMSDIADEVAQFTLLPMLSVVLPTRDCCRRSASTRSETKDKQYKRAAIRGGITPRDDRERQNASHHQLPM